MLDTNMPHNAEMFSVLNSLKRDASVYSYKMAPKTRNNRSALMRRSVAPLWVKRTQFFYTFKSDRHDTIVVLHLKCICFLGYDEASQCSLTDRDLLAIVDKVETKRGHSSLF